MGVTYYKATRVSGFSFYDPKFQYHIGQNVHPAPDKTTKEVCGEGIHLAKTLEALKKLQPNYQEIYEASPGVILAEDDDKLRCASCLIIKKLEPKEYRPLPEGTPINTLCGRDWILEHAHDLDGWTPTIEITGPGSKQTITVKNTKAMKQVIKILRE